MTFDLDLWLWPLTLTSKQVERQQNMSKHIFSQFDLELWPTTLTYNPNLAKVKVDPHATNQDAITDAIKQIKQMRYPTVGQTVQKLERKQQTDGRTDAIKRIISLASRSIIMWLTTWLITWIIMWLIMWLNNTSALKLVPCVQIYLIKFSFCLIKGFKFVWWRIKIDGSNLFDGTISTSKFDQKFDCHGGTSLRARTNFDQIFDKLQPICCLECNILSIGLKNQ